ncbi:Ger(x)C family spore germination protein [Paenibacillus dendritiformis]|uniref:Ger(x)C family spore germination protein n=1 Tax=Paenibacillus dendritiformis TaxID=130049 RepID=UPI00143DE288|nr:Ger(x)C family spore germination protein [Paenibacillus dendritiformis]NKI24560.1 Ger(x)C family spore germination protein [Paenibacillus dendritiformis]NRF99602.1 Ger(x)C family spore germination protein [Paenibacillus dendritiformis]
MGRAVTTVILLMLLLPVPGCTTYRTLENMTLSLLLCLDMDEEGNLLLAISSPVFSKEAKDNEEEFEVRSTTLRHSREEFDKRALGLTTAGKTQAVVVGKRLAAEKNWAELLDPFYRDTHSTVSARVIYFDGPIGDLIHFSAKDKPRLPLYLAKLVDTGLQRNETTKTTIQEFHRHLYEKGMTPSITGLRKDKGLALTGTALLDKSSKFKMMANSDETKLLYILRKKTRGEFPFTLHLPLAPGKGPGNVDMKQTSVNLQGIKTKIRARYTQGRFVFDVNIRSIAYVMERLFPYDVMQPFEEMEKKIAAVLEQQFNDLIRKLQKARIDPVGFGIYARAHAYPQWKKIQDRWEDYFEEAIVNVKVKVKIVGMGATK